MSREHWDQVWKGRLPEEVSWYQPVPTVSRTLIAGIASPDSSVLDVGGGASVLVDELLANGFSDLTLVDISAPAVEVSKRRLGMMAARVEWIVADVLEHEFDRRFDVWHDRALLHFLTEPSEVDRYQSALLRALSTDGHAVIGAFGPEGPSTCSGLPVRRYDHRDMTEVLGVGFTLLDHVEELHRTPGGEVQQFIFGVYQRN